MDNPNGICLGPGARDKVFLLVSLNQLGVLFIVNLQCVLAALGTEWSMKLSSYTYGPSGDSGQTQGMAGVKGVLEIVSSSLPIFQMGT